jgi:hypothetical protein
VENEDVFLPARWMGDSTMIAYSAAGYENRLWNLPPGYKKIRKAVLYTVSAEGQQKIGELSIRRGAIPLSLHKDQLLLIKLF